MSPSNEHLSLRVPLFWMSIDEITLAVGELAIEVDCRGCRVCP